MITLRRGGEARVKAEEEANTQPLVDFLDGVRRGEIDCYPARVELAYQDAMAMDQVPGRDRRGYKHPPR